MSAVAASPVPYVAPWQVGFERLATQLITPALSGFTLRATVPERQWWRVVYLSALIATSAVVANRQTALTIADAQGALLLQQFGPVAIPASALPICTWAPGMNTYSNFTDLSRAQETVTMPDLLWPPGTQVIYQIGNPQAGDGFGSLRVFAIEAYLPSKDRPGVFVPTPLAV